jgi:hypothetical protein
MPGRVTALLFTVCFALLPGGARGAYLSIPTTIVPGTADAAIGPTFTVVGDYGPDDLLSVRAVGTVDLDGGLFTANAAGVIVAPATTNTGNHPGQIVPAGNGLPFGSLLLGDGALGFHLLFPADASTGLGSAAPPVDLTALNARLGDVFGPSFTGLTSGTVLRLIVNDTPGGYGDNSGAFTVGSVPEPAAGVLAAVGALCVTAIGRRARGSEGTTYASPGSSRTG